MKTPDEARELWFSRVDELGMELSEETVPLSAALHRVISRPVEALRSSPAFHGAAMDGVAVKAEDTFTASPRRPLRLEIGKDAFWINTGHPLPAGCNAVVMVEHLNVEENGRYVVTEKAAFPWQHVRKLGEDMVATEIILAPGVVIGPYELGALAAAGVVRPPVFRKPEVAVIPSGSEIVALSEAREEDLRAGRALPEFNSLIFSAMIEEAGGNARVCPIVPDDMDRIREAIASAVEDGADLVIMNAGSSAGSHDYTADVIAGMGEVLVHGVAVMPGKPTALGIVEVGGRRVPIRRDARVSGFRHRGHGGIRSAAARPLAEARGEAPRIRHRDALQSHSLASRHGRAGAREARRGGRRLLRGHASARRWHGDQPFPGRRRDSH